LDATRVLPFTFVFLGKNLFEPMRLSVSGGLVRACGMMKEDELFTTNVAPQSAH
jgi:hypothetical protein